VRNEGAFPGASDDLGNPMGNLVFRPREIYKNLRNVPPDLLVHFGALYWRSIGGLGYDTLYVAENDTGPDDCNHAQFGAFLLAAPGMGMQGEVQGMHLLDIAPTLLDVWACHPAPRCREKVSWRAAEFDCRPPGRRLEFLHFPENRGQFGALLGALLFGGAGGADCPCLMLEYRRRLPDFQPDDV
jgi:hypothetical protein